MSFLRVLFIVAVILGVAVISTGAFAAVPLTMTHQGRLLDATDQPVNGFFDITYKVFGINNGGPPSLMWTEVHASVQVTDGLFSALLGTTVPLSADILGGGGVETERYLEVTVGGTTLLPRLRLSSVPTAVSAGRISGDIETLPGLIVIGDPLTDNHATFGEKVNQGLHAAGSALSQGATRITNECDGTSASQVMEKKGLNAVNVKLARTISSPPGGSLAIDALDMDSDDDGVMDRSISSSLDATGARSTWKGGMSGSTTGTIRMMTSPDSAVSVHETDTDGDGVPESSINQFSDGHVTVLKAMARGGSTTGTIRMMATPDSAVSVHETDEDGDGVPESSIKQSSDGHVTVLKAMGRSGSTTGTIRMMASGGGGPVLPSSDMAMEADLDGDGIIDVAILDSADANGASHRLKDRKNLGSSGEDGAEVQLSARQKGGIVKITASQNSQSLRCSSSADSAAATMLLEADLDGDGVMENTSVDSVDANGALRRLKSSGIGSSGNDGVEVQLSTRPKGGAVTVTASQNTQSLRCSSSADSAAATMLLDADLDDDGHSEISAAVSSVGSLSGGPGGGAAAAAYARMSADSDDDGVADVTAEMTADADSACFRLNGLPPGVQVTGTISMTASPTGAHMAVGAATCDGTNWVNASDVNSKENFTTVDGNELLNQIAQLSITRWNYKGNNQAEHIGPTAQDFKAAFGVGADDKSISTIDPSGIALAAIKALNNKMQELNAKTSQLENQAREITQLKAELDAIKAMLQKQAESKN